MRAYYNEIDPFCAQWLRNLIDAGHLPDGDVDTRSIADVRADDLMGYGQCHFFAGIGGWGLAARLAGWPDDRELWTGSCPCQPFSAAGKRAGMDDERHLWPEFHRLIAERRPAIVFGEQVAGAIGHGWLDRIFGDLEASGYACGAAVLQASSTNAPHKRERLWFVADAERDEQPRQEPRCRQAGRVGRVEQPIPQGAVVRVAWLNALTSLRALDDGLPRNVAATDAARNAIVPALAAEVIGAYLDCEAAA